MLKNGLAYIIQQGGLGRGLTVFDVTQPGLIRKIGHYNFAEELFKNILYVDDNKVILLGENIRIVKPSKSTNY